VGRGEGLNLSDKEGNPELSQEREGFFVLKDEEAG